MQRIIALFILFASLTTTAAAASNAVSDKNFQKAFDLNVQDQTAVKSDISQNAPSDNLDFEYDAPKSDDDEGVQLKPQFRYTQADDYNPKYDAQRYSEFKLKLNVPLN